MSLDQLLSEFTSIVQRWTDGNFENNYSQQVAKFVALRKPQMSINAIFCEPDNWGDELKVFLCGIAGGALVKDGDGVIVRDNLNALHVLVQANTSIEVSVKGHEAHSIQLVTNFDSFVFYSFDRLSAKYRPFMRFQRKEMLEHISVVGSIWQFIFPKYYGLVTRTMSFVFPNSINTTTFSNKKAVSNKFRFLLGKANEKLIEEKSALSQLSLFDIDGFNIVSLDTMRKNVLAPESQPNLVDEHTEAGLIFRRYSPKRSDIFNFGEPFQEFKRSDSVCTYRVESNEFHREFYLTDGHKTHLDRQLDVAAFDILHMLAIRRNSLFRLGFSKRVYNILLPPALLINSVQRSRGLVIFPCVNLIRIPNLGIFRRTLSITYIAAPVQVDENTELIQTAEALFLGELYSIKDEFLTQIAEPQLSGPLTIYSVRGPLSKFAGLDSPTTIQEVFKRVTKKIMKRVFRSKNQPLKDIDSLIAAGMRSNNRESKMATLLLQVSWNNPIGHTQPWERWLSTTEDKSFNNILFSTLSYRDFITPFSAYSSVNALKIQELNIGNTLGADMSGMTLYNPLEYMKLILFPKAFERYPNYSMLRWLAWQIYIDTALASLKALIEKFHTGLDDRHDLDFIIETLNEMVQEFVDLYDLDLINNFYRKEYEKIRKLLNIDLDYVQLMSKFTSSKEDASLREQRLINKLVFALTVTAVNVTIVTTLSTNEQWSSTTYVITTILSSVIVSWIGFVFFDPIRKGVKEIYGRFFQLFNPK